MVGLWLRRLRLLATIGLRLLATSLSSILRSLRLLLGLLLLLVLLLAFLLLALCLGQHAQIMLGMLLKVFSGNPVVRQLRVAGQLIILVYNLLRRAAHFAFGTRRIEHTVYDVTD